jgi:hypothetical protein
MGIYFIIFFIVSVCKCNFWDNMFSNINGPNLEIPKEFQLRLTNSLTNLTIAELLYSVSFNKIKLSLFDKKITAGFIKNLPIPELPIITNIYVDFPQGKVSLDFNSTCYWKNVSFLKTLTSEFFLKSYDLFTFFENNNDNYKYVFTNPFNKKETKSNNNTILLDSNLKDLFDEVDKKGIMDFIVNKNNSNLEKINLKYRDTKILNLDVMVNTNIKLNGSEFIYNDLNCTEIKELNSTNLDLKNKTSDLIKNTTSKFLPNK